MARTALKPASLLEAATPDASRALWLAQQTEAQFQANIMLWAVAADWEVYHAYDSRRSAPGLPDLLLVHPGDEAAGIPGRLLFREIKLEHARLTAAQRRWLWLLERAGADAGVWRPPDTARIQRELGYLVDDGPEPETETKG